MTVDTTLRRRVQEIMDLSFTVCPDFHRCYNGAPCVEHGSNEGSYYCDCLAIVDNDIYAGLSCEHVATSYCNDNDVMDPISFCTNGGSCLRMVDYDHHDPNAVKEHAGCDCLDGYKGEHCEFVDDQSVPNDFFSNEDQDRLSNAIKNVRSSDEDGKKSGVALPLVLVLLVVAALGASFVLVRRRRKRFSENHASSESVRNVSEAHLQADGSPIYPAEGNKNSSEEQDDTERSQVI